jgi:hypothetical protein
MPKLSEAKVGDHVLIKFKVNKIEDNLVKLSTPGLGHLAALSPERECEAIFPPHWVPKIGDIVHHVGRMWSPYHGVTLLHVHEDPSCPNRKWATVAYKGDIPYSISYEDLRPYDGEA